VRPTARLGTVEVTADGEGLVSHAGAALLVELADRAGLTGALSEALAGTRERRSAHDPGRVVRDVAVMLADGGDCITDVEAYLVSAQSEKERAAGNYKHGYGFHPLGCWLDETGEALDAILRPGNAGANTAEDHFTVLGLALAQLPAEDLDREILVRRISAARPTGSPATAARRISASRSATSWAIPSAKRSSMCRKPRGCRRSTLTGRTATEPGSPS
jgi:hypothetical protein